MSQISTREAAERKATLATEDTLVRNEPTSTAWTASHQSSNTTSVRDRLAQQEALKPEIKPKSYQDRVADFHYACAMATRAREEQKQRDERQGVIDRANKEKADKEREQKRGQYQFRQKLREDVFQRNNATDRQIAQVNQMAADAGCFDDLDYLEMTLKRIQLEAS